MRRTALLRRTPLRSRPGTPWVKPERVMPTVPVIRPEPRARMVVRLGDGAPVLVPKDEPLRSREYREWVAGHPCFGCGIHGHSQAAHPNFGKGARLKTDDRLCFPLCTVHGLQLGCHEQLDLLVDMTRDERRELEAKYVARMQAMARAAGRKEFA